MLPANNIRACLAVVLAMFLSTAVSADVATLENDLVRVDVDRASGCITVVEKVTGRTWSPDPWEGAAAVLRVRTPGWKPQSWNLSKCRRIDVALPEGRCVQVTFRSPVAENGQVVADVFVATQLRLAPDTADLDIELVGFGRADGVVLRDLEYPARHFSLRSNVDRGLAVFPFIQGAVVPSYLYPKPNSKFGSWDDYQHNQGGMAVGELGLYEWLGLSMPWFGIHDDTSAVAVLIPSNQSVGMQYILNYDDRDRFARQHQETSYPRILALTPVWHLTDEAKGQRLRYHFIPGGDHVDMAKYYRGVAKHRKLFVSLEEKARRVPDVEKMKGSIYLHVYGGYPHHMDQPDMAFTFAELKEIIRDLHDNQHVKKAFITVWGVWERYPPVHWPINRRAGGRQQLREVFDLAKDYGYLITPYHTWHALLQHDPHYNGAYLPRDPDGRKIITGRWSTVDKKLWHTFARKVLEKEIPAIGSNASYTDGTQSVELVRYLAGLNVPVTVERSGNCETFIPYYHCFEGMAPMNTKSPGLTVIEAPLFNLVYHDAVFTTNRWQSPDNDCDLNGDFAVRTLRNMLVGNLPLFVAPPWEYPGLGDQIQLARQLVVPLHEENGDQQMLSHEFLSKDFQAQRTRYANGSEVTVNMGLVARSLSDGTTMPGLGFRIRRADGSRFEGCFKTTLEFKTPTTSKETQR